MAGRPVPHHGLSCQQVTLVCWFKSTNMWICNPDIQKYHILRTYWVPQSSLKSICLNPNRQKNLHFTPSCCTLLAYSSEQWELNGIKILTFKLEHNQCNMFLFILLILKVNTKSCFINTWATKSLWPVSNLLPCRTQFIIINTLKYILKFTKPLFIL